MQAITLEVILRAVFGVTDQQRRAQLSERLPALLADTASAGLQLRMLIAPRLTRTDPLAGLKAQLDGIDELLFAEIAERRAEGDSAGREDILSLLMAARFEDGDAMEDRDLRDQLLTLLLAGHETTATALAWTFDLLLRNPAALARLTEEVDAGEDDEYLRAVVSESLRLRPVVPLAGRRLAGELELDGLTLPAGTDVTPAIWLTHTRPDLYPEPYAFRPERFLESRRRRTAGSPSAAASAAAWGPRSRNSRCASCSRPSCASGRSCRRAPARSESHAATSRSRRATARACARWRGSHSHGASAGPSRPDPSTSAQRAIRAARCRRSFPDRCLLGRLSPPRAVVLHDPQPMRERDAAGQRPAERAERRAVLAAHQQQVLTAAALRLGLEAQPEPSARAIRERSAAKLTGATSCGSPATHTARSLPLRRVVDALHEVERERRPRGVHADAGRPAPLGDPCVIAGRVVDHRQRVDRARRAAIEGDGAARGDPGLLARPDVAPPPCGQTASIPASSSSVKSSVTAPRCSAAAARSPRRSCRARAVVPARARRPRGAAAGACAPADAAPPPADSASTPATRPAQQHRPERLTRRPDLDDRRARHQLLAEDRDVAPALERARPAQQRHTSRWNGREGRRRRRGRRAARAGGLPGGGRDALRRYALRVLTDWSIYSGKGSLTGGNAL